MANIFKTTLKKDIIADIANENKREVRFPITKFWASRFTDEYDLDNKIFTFKIFDTLEFSSPANKETGSITYVFDFVKIFVDGDEFVIVFKDHQDCEPEICECNENDKQFVESECINSFVENVKEYSCSNMNNIEDVCIDDSDIYFENLDHIDYIEPLDISNEDVHSLVEQWFEDEMILDNFYKNDNVFATNAKQVIILPKGRVLGFKKTLPVNNDAEVRIEFDMSEKIYANPFFDYSFFENEVLKTLSEISKNNFVFVWKRYTGIFNDENGVYFSIKYSTRKSIGFNRKYNVQ
jgi:hypothetical protein